MIELYPMKHYGIDLGYLLDQYGHRGIGRYTREVARRLFLKSAAEDIHWHVFGFSSWEKNLKVLNLNSEDLKEHITYYSIDEEGGKTPLDNWRNYHLKLVPQVKQLVSQNKLDLFYAPYFEHGVPTKISQLKTAVTIHDAIPIITGHYSQKSKMHNLAKGMNYKYFWDKQKQADQIFTDSEQTLSQLLDLGFDGEKMQTVYLGVADEFFEAEKYASPEDYLHTFGVKPQNYIIYDSGLEENKNIEKLLSLMKIVHAEFPDLSLVITGGSFDVAGNALTEAGEKMTDLAFSMGMMVGPGRNIATAGRVDEPGLLRLLASAKAYINLSKSEGFGLGPLQAMAAGVPAIISDNACFGEISAAGASLVSLQELEDDIDSAAQKVIKLIGDNEALDELKERGKNHVTSFSWDNTANQILQQLKRLT